MSHSLGVGFLGAGLVTQAIHLPVLASHPDRFHVVSVMDIDEGVAEQVAARCGASFTTDVDAVVRGSQRRRGRCMRSQRGPRRPGDRGLSGRQAAVLCEKPLAESHAEAEQIRAAAAASGTHVVVGAMHVYDPAYRAAHRAWVEENERSVFTQSAIFLPSNDMFTGQATEPASAFPPNSSGAGVADAVMLRGAITGLAVHNLPLVRDFCPRLGHVETARFIQPFGYVVVVTDDVQTIELLAYMGGAWPPHWMLRTVGRNSELARQLPAVVRHGWILQGGAGPNGFHEGVRVRNQRLPM